MAGGWKKLHDVGFMNGTLVKSVFGLYRVVPCDDADFSEILSHLRLQLGNEPLKYWHCHSQLHCVMTQKQN
jgi:hypothetical protein